MDRKAATLPSCLLLSGAEGESFEDRLKLWARVFEETYRKCNTTPRPRAHRLGDVLGNTVAALLEFFQPYLGDEQVPWSDERRESVRFRVLRASQEHLVIEDSYFDEAVILPLEYLCVPAFHFLEWHACQCVMALNIEHVQPLPIHHFPIEELLADAVQQYFRDVSYHPPMFENVLIARIFRDPDDLEGPEDVKASSDATKSPESIECCLRLVKFERTVSGHVSHNDAVGRT